MNKYMRGFFVAALGLGYRVVMGGQYSKEAVKENFNPIAFASPILVNEEIVGKVIKPVENADKVENCKLVTGALALGAAYLLWMYGAESFIIETAYLGFTAYDSLKDARLGKLFHK